MTRKEDFSHFTKYARQLIVKNGGMHDVELMEALRKSPHSWKVIKSKLIEKYSLVEYHDENAKTGKKCTYEIGYDKKEKFWELINVKMN